MFSCHVLQPILCGSEQIQDSSKKESERVKQEVIHEASVFVDLGENPRIPHLLGVYSLHMPFYLVLEQLADEGCSVTLSTAATTSLIADENECNS